MDIRYTREQLSFIQEQAMIYQCACPAQVSELLLQMLDLDAYQANCLTQTDVDARVHKRIASAILDASPIIEKCLTDILNLEGWNLHTLEIPEFLQKRLLESIEKSYK
jgi:hypothetical protein